MLTHHALRHVLGVEVIDATLDALGWANVGLPELWVNQVFLTKSVLSAALLEGVDSLALEGVEDGVGDGLIARERNIHIPNLRLIHLRLCHRSCGRKLKLELLDPLSFLFGAPCKVNCLALWRDMLTNHLACYPLSNLVYLLRSLRRGSWKHQWHGLFFWCFA